ncbi:hypothetical protein L2Y96_20085 [Luteibacter aegosomaticola]|uniref:hypothetical protein n=1 Tax=Luteibacter aegosomaticola TaxID=2911538 RepID=UPI001FFBC44A|nr:hypothetical protein [Luteibacter aegosomaticola]UPG89662.1 hypothetical protein L2Y96_20085 [Luteibacter aegosomaticola]
MSLFRKSLTAELGGRAQRLAGTITHDRALELKGAARQYVGHAGLAVVDLGDDVRELVARAEKRAAELAAATGKRASKLASRTEKRASKLAALTGHQASDLAAHIGHHASAVAARVGHQGSDVASDAGQRVSKAAASAARKASKAASRASKQVKSHPRTSLAVGAGIGVAALAAAWLLRRSKQKQQAQLAHDEHDPTRYRASNDAGDALDGSGEDNPVPGESRFY